MTVALVWLAYGADEAHGFHESILFAPLSPPLAVNSVFCSSGHLGGRSGERLNFSCSNVFAALFCGFSLRILAKKKMKEFKGR